MPKFYPMKPVFPLILFMAMLSASCSPSVSTDQDPAQPPPTEPIQVEDMVTIDQPLPDSVCTMKLAEGITISWDNRTHSFYETIKGKKTWYYRERDYLMEQLSSPEPTPCLGCDNQSLSLGVLTFLYCNTYEHFPFYTMFGMQFDVWEEGCPYPVGLLDYLENNRNTLKESVMPHLKY